MNAVKIRTSTQGQNFNLKDQKTHPMETLT